MTTTRSTTILLLTLTLTLAPAAHASRKRADAAANDVAAQEAARIEKMSEAEVVPLLLDLVLGHAGEIEKMKQRPTQAYPYAKGKLHFTTKKGYQAFEQRMVNLVVKNTGDDAREAFQARACELRARAAQPDLDDDDARDVCQRKYDLGWYLKDAENPYMRAAMVLGLVEGKAVSADTKAKAMERLLGSLGHDVERYMVDVPDVEGGLQHFRLKELAPSKWGKTTFRLAWLVNDAVPAASKSTLAELKAAERKAPLVRCRTWAVVLVQDFDGRKYTAPYFDSSFYAGGYDTDVKVLPCKEAKKKQDKKLLKTIRPDWNVDDGKLIGAGPVRGADWIVGRELGRPVRKTKAVRVYVEEKT